MCLVLILFYFCLSSIGHSTDVLKCSIQIDIQCCILYLIKLALLVNAVLMTRMEKKLGPGQVLDYLDKGAT